MTRPDELVGTVPINPQPTPCTLHTIYMAPSPEPVVLLLIHGTYLDEAQALLLPDLAMLNKKNCK